MHVYILRRLILMIPVLLGLTVIVFLIMSLIPGDPALAILGSYATPENVAKLRADLGLDKSMVEQYWIWLTNMVQGDFGRSYSLNRPVLDEILEPFEMNGDMNSTKPLKTVGNDDDFWRWNTDENFYYD